MKSTVMNESVYSCLKFSNTLHILMHHIVLVLLKCVYFHFTFLLLKTFNTETCFYVCELHYVMP